MPDESKTKEVKAPELTRAELIKAYYDADKEGRIALFAKYPALKNIFSEGNHS